MTQLELIQRFGGSLNKDFVGQISYVFVLPKKLSELDIEFSFSPRKLAKNVDLSGLREEYDLYIEKTYGQKAPSVELDNLLLGAKTELHIVAELNGKFIGGIHRQEELRHLYFSKDEANKGCIPQDDIEGSLKITILSFNVLLDNTKYELVVRGR